MKSVPRPQAVRARRAILEAAQAVVEEEGPAALTHQRVAERAGVGRATVYRHWPESASLLLDVLETVQLRFLEPGPGSLAERALADLQRLADDLNAEGLASLAATLVERARWDERTRAMRQRQMDHIVHNTATALAEAVAAGELTGAPEPEELVCALIGPLWVQAMLLDRPITSAQVARTVDAALAPWTGHPG